MVHAIRPNVIWCVTDAIAICIRAGVVTPVVTLAIIIPLVRPWIFRLESIINEVVVENYIF